MDNYNNSTISEDTFYDSDGLKYTNVPLFRGFTKYVVTGGGAGVDGFESVGGTIGSGQRAEVIRALGFYILVSKSEGGWRDAPTNSAGYGGYFGQSTESICWRWKTSI